jgi:hypothetical protein
MQSLRLGMKSVKLVVAPGMGGIMYVVLVVFSNASIGYAVSTLKNQPNPSILVSYLSMVWICLLILIVLFDACTFYTNLDDHNISKCLILARKNVWVFLLAPFFVYLVCAIPGAAIRATRRV